MNTSHINKQNVDDLLQAATSGLTSGYSQTQLIKKRPGFGQTVIPAEGSIIASPGLDNWDPNPDYFFHWWRDAAVVMRAISSLMAHAKNHEERVHWNNYFECAVRFNLNALAGNSAASLTHNLLKETSDINHQKYLRSDDELASLKKDDILADTRINPDGTPDSLTWARPQYDGPALIAIICIDHEKILQEHDLPPSQPLKSLINQTLAFTARHYQQACIGLWEEDGDNAHHYYTEMTQLGAMEHGAVWAAKQGQVKEGGLYHQAASRLRKNLDRHWAPSDQYYSTYRATPGAGKDSVLDASVILAVNQSHVSGPRHTFRDDRMLATVANTEQLFETLYPLNYHRPAGRGIAIGRNKDDTFFGGNPWYWTTASVGEFYYNLAATIRTNGKIKPTSLNQTFCLRAFGIKDCDVDFQIESCIRRGDAQLSTIHAYAGKDFSLTEQFDKKSGSPISARHLGMSYSGVITALHAREKLLHTLSHP